MDVREKAVNLAALLPRSCVVVGGSAGTGELTTSDGERLSDIEIGVVGGFVTLFRLRRLRLSFAPVEIFWIAPWRWRLGLRRNLSARRPNQMAFDLARRPRLDQRRRRTPPTTWQASDLDVREALTLISNRVGELVGHDTPYHRVKLMVACGDAQLMARGLYASTYSARASAYSALEDIDVRTQGLVVDAYRIKLAGGLESVDMRTVREVLDITVASIVPRAQVADDTEWRLVVAQIWSVQRARSVAGRAAEWFGRLMRARRQSGAVKACLNVHSLVCAEAVIVADLLRLLRRDPSDAGDVLVRWRALCY